MSLAVLIKRHDLTLWCMVLSLYLIVCQVDFFPYAYDLLSSSRYAWPSGIDIFPSLLRFLGVNFNSLYAYHVIYLLACLLLPFNRFRTLAAVIVLYINLDYININFNLFIPETSLINWCLIGIILLSFISQNEKNKAKRLIIYISFIISAGVYFNSGLSKMLTPSWADGYALHSIILSPIGSDLGKTLIKNVPTWLLHISTWLVIIIQIAAPVALLNSKVRLYWWIIILAHHMLALFFLQIYQVNIGMVIFHLFQASFFFSQKEKLLST